jgi:thiosulfate dehydrogenase
MYQENNSHLLKVINSVLNLILLLVFVIVVMVLWLLVFKPKETAAVPANPTELAQEKVETTSSAPSVDVSFWSPPLMATLANNSDKELILYGKELIVHTSNYFGPKGSVSLNATNGLNCQNCHLDAGTRIYGNNYSAVWANYPRYRARSGQMETVEKRINDCFERSLDGKALDTSSKEMKAMVAYMKWLGKDVPKGTKPKGSGFEEMAFLDRPADPEHGKSLYAQKCASCHQPNGEGLMNEQHAAYTFPPLWGKHSYNTGAGLYRLSNFARFVKYNMPIGSSHKAPQLTDEEAWDIAAFVNSQTHPSKKFKNDWPKMAEKPFDHPFGPFADGYSEQQHKLGPFQPIQEKIAQSK